MAPSNTSSKDTLCYWPDGSIAPEFSSCNTRNSASPCCRNGEACLLSNRCYGASGLIYRGACTLKSYPDVECPNDCFQRELLFSATTFVVLLPKRIAKYISNREFEGLS